jgi:hypothetical protein
MITFSFTKADQVGNKLGPYTDKAGEKALTVSFCEFLMVNSH